ncbi:MAG: transferase, partial [Bacteroidetes bacterium]
MEEMVIIGTGGFGREVAWLHACLGAAAPRLKGWIGTSDSGPSLMGHPILGDDDWALAHLSRACGFGVAIGDPKRRREVAGRYESAGFQAVTLIHPAAQMGPQVTLGAGCIICAGAVLTVDIRLGRHVIVNLNATIGHDAVLGDFVTLAPGVH